MPFRPSLVAHEYFSADPPELPRRSRGEPGPQSITRAELTSVDDHGITCKALTGAGDVLLAQVTAAGEGIILLAFAGSGDLATCEIRDDNGVSRVTAERVGNVLTVTVDGPAVVTGLVTPHSAETVTVVINHQAQEL